VEFTERNLEPARCVAVFPVTALLLGLPLYGFGGVLPMDNPRTAELSSLARVVSMRRRLVFRKLPEKTTPAGIGRLPLVAGVPLASDRGAERILFAVINPGAGR
jgi:hypothetical protein